MPGNYTFNENLENPQDVSVNGTEEAELKHKEESSLTIEPQTLESGNSLNFDGMAENPNYSYDGTKRENIDSVTIDGNIPKEEISLTEVPTLDAGDSMSFDVEKDDTPVTTINGENDTTPVTSFDGMAENPNYSYDEKKGETATPITIDGNISTDTPTKANMPEQTATPNATETPEQKQEPAQADQAAKANAPAEAGKDKDFSAGFKFSKEVRNKVAANNKGASFWGAGGIMDQFLNSKTPEDAFQGLFINMLLYLPSIAVKMVEMKKAKMEERNKYMKEKRNAYEDQIAQMKGLNGTDRLRALHQDFIKTGGNMATLAAEIREKNPNFLKDLGIEFDENGMAKNIDKKKEEALAKAVFTERYKELYNGILPSNDKLGEMWSACKVMKESGLYEQMHTQQLQAKQEQPQPQSQQDFGKNIAVNASATSDYTYNEKNNAETPNISVNAANSTVNTPKQPEAPQFDVNKLIVNPETLGVHSFEAAKEKMLTIDGKPLDERPPMNLKDAHETSLSVATPTSLKTSLSAYSATVAGLKTQENQVKNDRSALTAARNMAFTLTEKTNSLNVNVGLERT